MKIQKAARQFLPEDLAITDFGVLTPYFQELLERQFYDGIYLWQIFSEPTADA